MHLDDIAQLVTTLHDLSRWLRQVDPRSLDRKTRHELKALEAQILATLRTHPDA
jgi:hypothetical protein